LVFLCWERCTKKGGVRQRSTMGGGGQITGKKGTWKHLLGCQKKKKNKPKKGGGGRGPITKNWMVYGAKNLSDNKMLYIKTEKKAGYGLL